MMIYCSISPAVKEHVASALIKWFNTNYHYIVPEWDNVEPKVEKTHYSNALNTPNLSMLMPIQLSLAQLLSSNFLKVATNHLKSSNFASTL